MTAGTGTPVTYGFDASGNLSPGPAGATGTYNGAGKLTASTLSGLTTTYTYDADGQRLTAQQGPATTATGTWNGANELTSYTDSAAAISSATYDGTGMRTADTMTPISSAAPRRHTSGTATTCSPTARTPTFTPAETRPPNRSASLPAR